MRSKPHDSRPKGRASLRRRRDILRGIAAVAVGLVSATTPAGAQTPATAPGLGLPVSAIDARSAALGGTGLGLAEGSLSARNPADIALFGRPLLGITYAPEDVTVRGLEGDAPTGRSRLSVLRGAVPFGRWAAGVSFAAELDQDWQVEFSDTLVTDEGTFPYREQRAQDGGLSSVNFTLARRLGAVNLGAEFGLLTGRLQQTFRREFEPELDDPTVTLAPSAGVADWEYSGTRFRFGVAAAVTPRVHVGADVSLQGDLTAERDTIGGEGRRRKIGLPASFEGGASARVTDRLLLTAAGGWTAWSDADRPSGEYVASDVTWFGAGAELTGTRVLGLTMPLRIGVRHAGLPFHPPGTDQPTERAVTFGFGVRVAEERARIDVGLEAGSRGDLDRSGVEESFRRLWLTLALFQD